MPGPIPRSQRPDDTAADVRGRGGEDGEPFWLSRWPFLEPKYPGDWIADDD